MHQKIQLSRRLAWWSGVKVVIRGNPTLVRILFLAYTLEMIIIINIIIYENKHSSFYTDFKDMHRHLVYNCRRIKTVLFTICKGKDFPNGKSWRPRVGTECWASILTLTFGTMRTAELLAVSAGPTVPSKKYLGTRFC
jgi:hypothetical protein